MKSILTAACFFLCNVLYCQQNDATITGLVKDKVGNQVLVGDAILYIGDSIAYHSTILDGDFELENISKGSYLLKIKCLGYQAHLDSLDLKSNLNLQIELKEDANLLEEVTLTSVRDNITFENGNVKVNLVNSIFAEQASTLDALSMMPGIITDPVAQTISLIASGSPLLYIGNRNISMDEFLAIPITNIDVIEIVNNPSAKYEASGRSVILITLLRGLDDGIRVELSNNAVKRRHFNNYAGINGSLRKENFEIKSNFGFNSLNTWEGVDNTIEVFDEGIKSTNSVVSKGDRPQFVGGVGLFYSLNESDYISNNGNFRKHTTDAPLNSYSITSFPDRIDSVNTFLAEDEDRGFYTANINYNNKFGSSNIFAGVQTSRYHRGVKSDIFNDLNPLSLMVETRNQDYIIDVLAGRLDYEMTFNPSLKLELGTNIYTGIADAFQQFKFANSG